MPLPLTVSCFSKIQIGFTFLVPAHLGCPGKRAVKRVYVCVVISLSSMWTAFFVVLLTKRNNRPIIGIGRLSADADCQMADTDYQPIIGAPLILIIIITDWYLSHILYRVQCTQLTDKPMNHVNRDGCILTAGCKRSISKALHCTTATWTHTNSCNWHNKSIQSFKYNPLQSHSHTPI